MSFFRCLFALTLFASCATQAQTALVADTALAQSFSYALEDTFVPMTAPLTLDISAESLATIPTGTSPSVAAKHDWLPEITHAGEAVASSTGQLISTAMKMIGVPYRRGGSDAGSGFDCSGFVRNVYAQALGLVLPRVARDQARATTKIDKNELRPGDLVFFNTMRKTFSHVGIYLGEGKFIHSPRSGASVRIESMDTQYWRARFNGARRVAAASGLTASGQANYSLAP